MRYETITPDKYKSMPWKNGKGTTRELYIRSEEGKDEFIFRLSIAGVTENGPFSDFSGYDRVLMMLEGNGVDLKHSDGTSHKIRGYSDMAVFSGDLKTTAELCCGPIKDFNVMTLREVCQTEVIAVNGEVVLSENSGELFIFCCGDSAEAEFGNKVLTINYFELLHISDFMSGSVRITGDAIAVKILFK
ncbi:MAG TPA: HutD family protein [Clostridiales bacterium]|nr:HutD family protein [Clostridiales bacterium]HQP69573.1 HutD family protein [Clostridiales bacterium]